ncbi:CidA/LrgA family protein [Gordonibacter sp. 28C]|uniref:CidA/LrgA family protein n=1 Tax=Gordonibacter sp. 28C TaxID=2078569 RepID=UPI001F54468E|nr:CidA/LrgA family protein [Gordonibacter sp. 28C]
MEQSTEPVCESDERMPAPAEPSPSKRRRALHAGKRVGVLLVQLSVVVAVYAAGCALASVLPVSLPGNIVGMVLLLVLLGTGLLKGKHVGRACTCLLDNMSLFFIPAGVAIMGCFSLLEGNVLKFALVCAVTTVLVFLATSYTVIAVSRLMERRSAPGGQPATADEEG